MKTARSIAEKYVYGKHDALTDEQEVIDMANDIEQFASQFRQQWVSVEDYMIQGKPKYDVVDIYIKGSGRITDALFDGEFYFEKNGTTFDPYSEVTHVMYAPTPPSHE